MYEDNVSAILDKLQTISEKSTSIDLRVHKRYTENDLDGARKEISTQLEKANRSYFLLIAKADELKEDSVAKWFGSEFAKQEFDEFIQQITATTKGNKIIYDKIDQSFTALNNILAEAITMKRKQDENSCYRELFSYYNDLRYSFRTARDETKNFLSAAKFDENAGIILLCKNVRIMEDLINKICTNNIDKSIIGGEQHFDSIKYGFEWLFCHEDLSGVNIRKQLDIRDCNRYLDYIKYQIMVASKYAKSSYKDSEKIDSFFEKIKFVFDSKEFEEKTNIIAEFKKESRTLINDFFNVYELLINYRDALFREEEIRKSFHDSTPLENTTEHFITINPFITNLSSVAVRVLLDRFVSFVKISDLNFGNSTFNRAWFNYSELSKSNYAGSNFKYARIENAKMRDCDISTCNLILADGGHTDFSYSNFNFSNLSGINLSDAIVNHCEFQNAIFIDANINNYKNAIYDALIRNRISEQAYKRACRLLEIWKKDPPDGVSLSSLLQMVIDNCKKIDLKELDLTNNSNNSWAVLQYTPGREDPLDEPAEIMKEITNLFLNKHISAELLQYMRDYYAGEDPSAKSVRIKNHGSILLDPANLTSISAKYAQLGGSDLSHVIMPQSSFENADLSSVTMHYTSASAASFIYSNINRAECFETDFRFVNFSSAVANNALLFNCNLDHTNWNKAIIISAVFADCSHEVEDIISENSKIELHLQTDKCIRFCRQDNIILDLPAYEKCAACSQPDSLHQDHEGIWQRKCCINDATFIDALADNVIFFNIETDRSTFNQASCKNSFWANCRAYLSDFISTDFRYSMFMFCCMGQSNFRNANLTSAIIRYVDYSNCNLSSALFNLSNIDHVLFSSANIRHINFSGAEIRNSAFENCKFNDVILSETKFIHCIFSHVDFNNLIGYHSSEYKDCYFYDCSFNEQLINDGIQNLRELFEN